MKRIDLEKIRNCVPALSESWAEHRLEAALICLDHNNHTKGIECIHTSKDKKYSLHWKTEVSDTLKRTHGDIQDATEIGAEGMAALFADELTPYRLVHRSHKGTGFDYWLGYETDGRLLFQRCARLEISGLINGSDAEFKRRISEKKKQTKRSESTNLPAYVSITDFGIPRIAFEKV